MKGGKQCMVREHKMEMQVEEGIVEAAVGGKMMENGYDREG